jgi:hypothetical protein
MPLADPAQFRRFLLAAILSATVTATVLAAPAARAGTIDLAGQDWTAGPVSLAGEWLVDGKPVAVPGKVDLGGSAFGRGQYRLDLRADPDGRPYALRLPSIYIASEVTVNGRVLARNGVVGDSVATELPSYPPGVLVLPPDPSGAYDIRIDFSNHRDIYAGITTEPRFGPAEAVAAERERAIIAETVVFGGLLLLGLYQCGSFFFRTGNRAPLWLGILGLMVAFRATLYGELILQAVFPGVSWFFIIRSVYLTMTLALLAFMHYIHNLFPRFVHRRVFPPLWAATAVFGLLDLFAPIQWVTSSLWVFQLCILAGGAYGLGVLVRALWSRSRGRASSWAACWSSWRPWPWTSSRSTSGGASLR